MLVGEFSSNDEKQQGASQKDGSSFSPGLFHDSCSTILSLYILIITLKVP